MIAIEQDLYTYLNDNDAVAHEAESEGFSVDSIDKAEWCMRKLAKLAQEDAADVELAQRELERIQGWLAERQAHRQQSREFFETNLQKFHYTILLSDDRQKTIKLPHGTLKARKLPDKWEYNDAAILEWAKKQNRPEFIRVKEEVVKDTVKRVVKEDGEKVPGVTIIPQGMSFAVEVTKL